MKLIIAVVVFFVALGLSFKTIASDPAKNPPNDPAMCGANENPENCHQSKGEGAAHGGGHGDLQARMNSLFPEHKHQAAEYARRPQLTKLVSPKFLAQLPVGPVKLQWSETQGATNYHVQVATDPNFKWLLVNEYNAKGNSFDLTQLQAGKRYFWRVASVKDSNLSSFTKSTFVSSAFDTNP